MQEKLRRSYQIQKEVSRGGYYQGRIEVSDLARLSEFLLSDQAIIEVEFSISQSDYGTPIVQGRLETNLAVECQRCLEAMEIPLQIDFKLLVDADDDMIAVSSLDTVYSEEGTISIFEVVEDEIILGLPLVIMHEDVACNEFWQTQEQDPEQATKENPFSVLAKLKTTT
jgi:uncharacterized protein